MAQYTRTTTVDSGPAGDTTKQAVLDVDTDLTGVVAAYNDHDTDTTGVHGVGAGTVCGTTLTQTLTNKTLTSPTVNGGTISGATITGASTLNGLTHTAATTGFTIAGGSTSKTLTVSQNVNLDEAVAMSSKATQTATTWTPAISGLTFGTTHASYVKTGSIITFSCYLASLSGTTGASFDITGLPNNAIAASLQIFHVVMLDADDSYSQKVCIGRITGGTATIGVTLPAGYTSAISDRILVTGTYIT
jgi:hypothetical protein